MGRFPFLLPPSTFESLKGIYALGGGGLDSTLRPVQSIPRYSWEGSEGFVYRRVGISYSGYSTLVRLKTMLAPAAKFDSVVGVRAPFIPPTTGTMPIFIVIPIAFLFP